MNWFTNKIFKSAKLVEDEVDLCEHLEDQPNQTTYVQYENDSFGKVGSVGLCGDCLDKRREEEEKELYVCHDCNTSKPSAEGTHWTAHDHYPAQGDEPMFICDDCIPKDKHVSRVDRDAWLNGIDDEDDY